jgi:hypothetical protein
MATFEVQIEGLTGLAIDGSSAPTQDEITQFLRDGVIEVTNRCIEIKPEMASVFSRDSGSFQTNGSKGEGITHIIAVTRGDYPCREIPEHLQGRVQDKSSLHYASGFSPVYARDKEGKIYVYPPPAAMPTVSGNVLYVNTDPVNDSGASLLYSHDTIKYFPKDKIYVVILYAGIKSLENKLSSLHGNTEITAAFTAAHTELDETQAVCDAIHTHVTNATDQLGEAAAAVDTNIDTAASAITTASGRINTAVGLASDEFDKAVGEAVHAEAEADDGAITTALGAIRTNVDAAVLDVAKARTEAEEMATQTDNSGAISTALTAVKTELDKVDEVIVLASDEFDKCDAKLALGETDTEAAVNTALGKMVTELDETQAVCDLINGEVDKAFAEIELANAEADELATQTDSASGASAYNVALTAINTAVDHFRGTSDPALFGDEDSYTSGTGMKNVVDALSKAQNLIDAASMEGDTEPESAQYWLKDEDPEMVQATLATAQTEMQRAQTHIAEWTALVQTLQAEINGFVAEVQARATFSNSKTQGIQSFIATAQSYLGTAEGYAQELQSKIAISGGYSTEVQTRLMQAQAKREESRSRIELGTGYLSEAQSIIAQANGYASEVQARGTFTGAKSQAVQSLLGAAAGYVQAAQGFAAEVNAYATSAGIFIGTSQNRINVGNAYLSEAQAAAMEVQAYVNEVSARVQQIGGYSQVVQGYLQAAQTKAGELQSKIAIGNAYMAEVQARLGVDSQEYQWYFGRLQLLKQQYNESFEYSLISKRGVQNES